MEEMQKIFIIFCISFHLQQKLEKTDKYFETNGK